MYLFQEKLSEELRDAMKKSRKESELNTVDSQIKGLDMRLKYGKTDKENTVIMKKFVFVMYYTNNFIYFYSLNK